MDENKVVPDAVNGDETEAALRDIMSQEDAPVVPDILRPSEKAETASEPDASENDPGQAENQSEDKTEESADTAAENGEVNISDEPEKKDEAASPANQKDPEGITGVDLAVSLCDAVFENTAAEAFHGGVRPDNISVQGREVSLGGRLEHNVGEFTPQELEYMAPELFWDGVRLPTSDVYSIGLILYSVYNYGRLPFWPASGAITPNARASALQKRMSNEAIQAPARAEGHLSEVILKALAFRTEDRYVDVCSLKKALSGCDDDAGASDISLAMSGLLNRGTEQKTTTVKEANTSGEESDNDPQIRRPTRRTNLSWLWILLLVLFVIGAAILLLSSGKTSSAATVEATAEPTIIPVATATPEPTAEPTATPTPSGERYTVVQMDCTWTEAKETCERMGGKLAVPTTQEELDTIRIVCERSELNYVWLGASRQDDNSWQTTDGQTLNLFFWADGEPSYIDENDGQPENYMMLVKTDDTWLANDSRDDPLTDYGWIYSGQIGFLCQNW